VMYAPYGNSVFVITGQDKELTIQRRQVKTGAVRGNRIEIIEGFAECLALAQNCDPGKSRLKAIELQFFK